LKLDQNAIENKDLDWDIDRDVPDTDLAGYLANPKAGYRISGGGRISDIRPGFMLNI
jgi:hypothetical protein